MYIIVHFLFGLLCNKNFERLHGFCTSSSVLFFSISETVSLARELSNKSEATKQKCEPAAVYDCRKQGVIAAARPSCGSFFPRLPAVRLAS